MATDSEQKTSLDVAFPIRRLFCSSGWGMDATARGNVCFGFCCCWYFCWDSSCQLQDYGGEIHELIRAESRVAEMILITIIV